MKQLLIYTSIIVLFRYVVCVRELCGNSSMLVRSCSAQVLRDQVDSETCLVGFVPPNSQECKDMIMGPITENKQMGDVKLNPYLWEYEKGHYHANYTVLNITFSNIKWKMMKFRFQRYGYWSTIKNHCRTITISHDVAIDDQSVLYYDCYWSKPDGNYNNYILDFEATDDKSIKRGQYYFKIPSTEMLSPVVETKDWKPFTYIEIRTSTLKLHIPAPPKNVKIKAYQIEVVKMCQKCTHGEEAVANATLTRRNFTEETTYEYGLLRNSGSYYFVITPLHEECINTDTECQYVKSPIIFISNEVEQTTYICIASITSLIVATLFAYYVALRVIRKYWCKDYSLALGNEVPVPPKILIIYSPANKLHAECVTSFVNYLRYECGLDVMYDGDVSNTSHGDPYIWAEEAFKIANHILYVAGPVEGANLYNNIYDQPIINAHRNVDALQLNFLKASRAARMNKNIANVVFEHSNGGIPVETRHDRVFFLLNDWQKLISFLSKNLLPKQQMIRTEKGRCLLEDLKRAKKLLNQKSDDIVVKCENVKMNVFEKKVLL